MTASRPSWLASVHHETAAMRRAGVLRLLVISGEPGWCSRQAAALCDALAGDWLWVGEQSERGVGCRPAALKTLLGREFLHAVFETPARRCRWMRWRRAGRYVGGRQLAGAALVALASCA